MTRPIGKIKKAKMKNRKFAFTNCWRTQWRDRHFQYNVCILKAGRFTNQIQSYKPGGPYVFYICYFITVLNFGMSLYITDDQSK